MERSTQVVGDVAHLPDYSFGPTSLGWWGVIGFIMIEGVGFLLAIGAYYFLVANEQHWPPYAKDPPLAWATAFLVLGLVSEIPNLWLKRRAEAQDRRACELGLLVVIGFGLLMLVARGFEFAAMNVRWDSLAYGSIVWALIVLHTFHTITDVFDSGVLAALVFTKKVDGRKFSDVADNCFYWHFIVGSWVVLYVVIYWTPRWL